jgi:hypothetical protein
MTLGLKNCSECLNAAARARAQPTHYSTAIAKVLLWPVALPLSCEGDALVVFCFVWGQSGGAATAPPALAPLVQA